MGVLTRDRLTLPQQGSGSHSWLTVRLLSIIARVAEAYPWLVFLVISFACGRGQIHAMSTRPLDHDELFTFYIAQARTIGELLHLSRTVDLHPPLSYVLVRGSFAVFGVSSWACRLPFFLAFFLAGAFVFSLTRRLLSPIYGFIALLLLWSNPFAYHAEEARPYSLVVCFTSLMLLTWSRAGEDGNSSQRWTLFALMGSGFGLLLSHVLGSIPYAAFLAAELLRFRRNRKADWAVWTALLVPLSSVLLYLPLLRSHANIAFATEYAITPLHMASVYWESIRYVAAPLVLIGLVTAMWPVLRRDNSAMIATPRIVVSAPIQLIFLCLSATPLAIGVLFARTGTAFFDRYGIVWIIPLSLLPALFMGQRTSCERLSATAIALVSGAVFFFNSSGKPWLIEQTAGIAPASVAAKLDYVFALPPIWRPSLPVIPGYLSTEFSRAPFVSNLAAVEPGLPIVAHTGLTFLELDHQLGAEVVQRLYFLSDETAASTIAHDTVFAHYERLKEVFPIRGKIEPYLSFIPAHPEFLVVGAYNNPQGWLLRKLDRDGAKITVVGICAANTEACQIYKVEMPDAHCQLRQIAPSCGE